jgi:hypothetical protein
MDEIVRDAVGLDVIGVIPAPDKAPDMYIPMTEKQMGDTLRAHAGEYFRVDANGLVYVKNASGFQFIELTVDVFPVDYGSPPPMLSAD